MNIKQLCHFDAVSAYEIDKYDTLIHDHNVISNQLKKYEIDSSEDEVIIGKNGNETYTYNGWLSKKGRTYYLLAKEDIDKLPVRINQEASQEVILKDGKHVTILHMAKSFKIIPEPLWTPKQLLDNLCPFDHSNQDEYRLYKIMMLTAWISRINVRFCTQSEFGKDSVNGVIQPLLQDFKVAEDLGTFPAILREVTQWGVLVFNEACGNIEAKVRNQMSKLMFRCADGKNTFQNPSKASAAHGTKDLYRTDGLSIVAIYNTLQQYSEKKMFFDYQFSNSTAINSRMLPLKASGEIIEDFTNKNTNFTDLAKSEYGQDYYRSFLKTIHHLKSTRKQYKQRWVWKTPNKFTTRHSQSFYEIALTCDQMSETQEEMDNYLSRLIRWNDNYYRMLKGETDLRSYEEPLETPKLATVLDSPLDITSKGVEDGFAQRSNKDTVLVTSMTSTTKEYIVESNKDSDNVPLVCKYENIETDELTLRDL